MSKRDEEKYLVQSMLDFERDHLNDKAYCLRIGEEKGLEKGLKKGKKEGEKNKSLEIAKNMLKKSYKIEDIAELSGLSIDEIEKINK